MAGSPQWITVAEAALLVDRDPRTIRRWIKDEVVEKLRTGRLVFVRSDQVMAAEGVMDKRLESPHFGRHAGPEVDESVSSVSSLER